MQPQNGITLEAINRLLDQKLAKINLFVDKENERKQNAEKFWRRRRPKQSLIKQIRHKIGSKIIFGF